MDLFIIPPPILINNDIGILKGLATRTVVEWVRVRDPLVYNQGGRTSDSGYSSCSDRRVGVFLESESFLEMHMVEGRMGLGLNPQRYWNKNNK